VHITYAQSDPSLNRTGDWTNSISRRQLAWYAKTSPILILVVIGGGLSLILIEMVRRGVQYASGK